MTLTRAFRERGDLAEPSHTDTAADSLIHRLGRDTWSYAPAALLPAAASLASVSVFTRIFDSAQYGRFALVVATVSLSCLVLSGWIQQSILRYLPQHAARGNTGEFSAKTKGLLAALNSAVAAVLVAAYYGASPRLGPFEPLFLPAVLLLVAEIALLNLNTLFQAGLRSGAYAGFRIAGALFRFGGAVLVVLFFRRSVTGLILGMALGQVLVVLPMWWVAGRVPGRRPPAMRMDRALVRSFFSYGMPVIGWTLGGQLLSLSDRYIIGVYRGAAEVGVYSASYNLVAMGFGLVATPLLMAAHPIIMNAWQRMRREDVPGAIRSFSRYYLLAALPVVAVVSVLGREIVQLLVGEAFHEGYRVVPWVLGGTAAWGLAMYGHKGFELLEQTGRMFALVAVSAVVNVVLNLLFVPRFGFVAAAVSTFVGYALYPVLVWFVSRSGLRWELPWRTALVAAVSAGGAAFVARWVANATAGRLPAFAVLLVGAAAGFAVYGVLVGSAGEIGRGRAGKRASGGDR